MLWMYQLKLIWDAKFGNEFELLNPEGMYVGIVD